MILVETKNIDDALNLYKDYINVLIPKNPELEAAIKGGETVEKIAAEELTGVMEHPTTELLLIKHMNLIVGFMIIGQYPNASCKETIYIQEFYIDKKRQRKGFGRYAVKMLLARYKNKPIEMLVLRKNKGAKRFWMKMMTRNGYHDATSEHENQTAEDKKGEFCEWFYFEPSE